jgi:hypothetical protein
MFLLHSDHNNWLVSYNQSYSVILTLKDYESKPVWINIEQLTLKFVASVFAVIDFVATVVQGNAEAVRTFILVFGTLVKENLNKTS